VIADRQPKTLPPGEGFSHGQAHWESEPSPGFCSECGQDRNLQSILVAERDRLAAELRTTRTEIARLRGQAPLHPRHEAPPSSNLYSLPALATAQGVGQSPLATPVHAPFVPVTTSLPTGAVGAAQQGIDFGAVGRLSPEELDRLPYGLITLDSNGRVLHYNDTESRLVGLPRERVVGKSFFADVAPCTRVREFEGRFTELARDPVRVRVQSFDFVFRFARGEHHVSIVLTPARVRGQFHMALVRRAILGG
jgi:photoactive yellow protein